MHLFSISPFSPSSLIGPEVDQCKLDHHPPPPSPPPLFSIKCNREQSVVSPLFPPFPLPFLKESQPPAPRRCGPLYSFSFFPLPRAGHVYSSPNNTIPSIRPLQTTPFLYLAIVLRKHYQPCCMVNFPFFPPFMLCQSEVCFYIPEVLLPPPSPPNLATA